MVVVVCVRQSRMVKRVKSNSEQSHSTQSQFNWFVCHSKVRRVSALSSVRKFSTIFPLWYSPPAKLESSSSHISWRVWINTLFVLWMFGDQADHRSYAEVWCDRQSLSCRCASVLCACVLCINQSIRIFLSVADWCLICTARCCDKYQCRLSAVFGFGRNVYTTQMVGPFCIVLFTQSCVAFSFSRLTRRCRRGIELLAHTQRTHINTHFQHYLLFLFWWHDDTELATVQRRTTKRELLFCDVSETSEWRAVIVALMY